MGRKTVVAEYICVECQGVMNPADDVVLVCSSCGHSVDIEDYGFEDEYDDYYSIGESLDDAPEGCVACGGPYPSCKTSCKIFD